MRSRRSGLVVLALALGACATATLDFGPPGTVAGGPDVSVQAGLESATVRWSAWPGASSYVVYVQPTNGAAVAVPADGTTALVSALEGGRFHSFRVAALSAGTEIASSPLVRTAPIPVGHAGLGPRTVHAWTSTGGGASFRFGFPVVEAGDVDADGFDDVLIGANQYAGGSTQEGASFLFRGTPEGLETSPAWSVESNQAFAHSGKGLAAAGDLNDDGYPDVVVAAPDYDAGETGEGRAWLYEGDGLTYDDTVASWIWESNEPFAYTGRHIGAAGDVNGDGIDDLLLSVHGWDGGTGGSTGQVHVFHGGLNGLAGAPSATMHAEDPDSSFGYGMSATRGDADGDGYDDVLVGAYLQNVTPFSDAGKVFLFRGGPAGLDTTASWSYSGAGNGERSGVDVEFVGDVNGDGYDDFVVGADGYLGGSGRALLFHGAAGGPTSASSWKLDGAQAGAGLGSDVAGAGDVNGDGFQDVAVGAYRWDGSAIDVGRAWIYLGGPDGLSLVPSWEVSGPVAQAFFGGALTSAGDVNGDGADDLLVGIQGFESVPIPVGRAWLYLGAPPVGPSVEAGTSAVVAVDSSFSLGDATFAGSAAGAPYVCTVDWGDGLVDVIGACELADLRAATHAYTAAAARVVRVRVTSAFGVHAEAAITLTAR